jgi:DNA-directed RNA polymerase sigma subunit (sigma70/sigma32)
VESALETYESRLRDVNFVCADPWFSEQLAACRAGDESAWRRISESCLGLVLDIAKRTWQVNCALDLLDLTQEGNAVLAQTIRRFTGHTASEFVGELTQRARQRLEFQVDHPDRLE